ncbi:MAG: alcohol dehydrogenase catalytic domain-containing protein, partial [Acidobacteria bacterium]|nr:alcohol dehydrogenase catalytic domain-containing protein [Acidobacteriota bacterium]
MKAIVQERYGSLDRLEVSEVSVPAVGAGEVLVRVQAASLHPDVWHVIMGRPFVLRCMGAGALRPKQPIPGTDLAGVVEAVGEGVTRFQPGDEVFGDTVSPNVWTHGGTFAELVAIPEDRLQPKPAGVTFEQAASV